MPPHSYSNAVDALSRRTPYAVNCLSDLNMPMGEYPSTSLNKAVLKFRRQGRKKSQNVSAGIAVFFLLLFGKICRVMRNGTAFRAVLPLLAVQSLACGARCVDACAPYRSNARAARMCHVNFYSIYFQLLKKCENIRHCRIAIFHLPY